MKQAAAAVSFDPFFPSGQFAKVPAEAFGSLAVSGPHALTHAEFRLLASLCRFRGVSRLVYPTRALLERLTGMTPNNVSRITKSLQKKGWLTICYVDGNVRRKVANYELCVPVSGTGVKTVKPTAKVESDSPAPARHGNDTRAQDSRDEMPEANDLSWDDLFDLTCGDASS